MSAADSIDQTFNTTSIPSTGIYSPTVDQFFCQLTKHDVRCVSLAQFAAQPFNQLCPSGDCWTDCQDLSRLYAPLPDGITFTNETAYGTPPNVTLWPLCAALPNITHSLHDGVAPEAEAAKFKSFFANDTMDNLRGVAAAATQCWTETCGRARHPEDCTPRCAAVNLLESRTMTQLAGTRECIQSLCLNITGLPVGNQDIVGIGVSISYVIQSVLVILCWLALAVNGYLSWRSRRRSKNQQLSESRETFLKSVSKFQAAQCYFSITLAIAAMFTNPFTLDPLNAFGLLPVSTNGFLPEILTLMIMNYHGQRNWYPFILTSLSYVLNTIIFWAVISYLDGIRGRGAALKAPAYQSLGGIDACGGMTGIGLCLQFQMDSPPAFLIQSYGAAAWVGIRLAPWFWAWCTICLALLTFFQFRTTAIGDRLRNQTSDALRHSAIAPVKDWVHRTFHGAPTYYIASAMFFGALVYQAVMFYSFLKLGLVDFKTFSFGQIVALTVWVPPIVDYLHEQFDVSLKIHTPGMGRMSSPELHTPLQPTHQASDNQGYAPAARRDDEDELRSKDGDNATFEYDEVEMAAIITRPNDFPLASRRTRDFEDTEN